MNSNFNTTNHNNENLIYFNDEYDEDEEDNA